MRRLILTVMGFVACFALSSQDFADDINNVLLNFNESSSMHIKTSLEFYLNNASTSASKSETSEIKMKEGYSYSNLMGNEVLVTPKHTIMVNNKMKTLSLYKNEKQKKKEVAGNAMLPNIDSLMNASASQIRFIGDANGVRSYAIHYSNADLSEVVYRINTTTETIETIEYYYADDSKQRYKKIVITYDIFDLNAVHTDEEFSIYGFVNKTKTEWIPIGKYEDYDITYRDFTKQNGNY